MIVRLLQTYVVTELRCYCPVTEIIVTVLKPGLMSQLTPLHSPSASSFALLQAPRMHDLYLRVLTLTEGSGADVAFQGKVC